MLTSYGWSNTLRNDFAIHAAQGLVPGRIIVQQRGGYRLITELGEIDARAENAAGAREHQAPDAVDGQLGEDSLQGQHRGKIQRVDRRSRQRHDRDTVANLLFNHSLLFRPIAGASLWLNPRP